MPLDAALAVEAATVVNGAFAQAYQNILQPNAGIGRFLLTGGMGTKKAKIPISGLLGNWRRWYGERIFHDVTRYMLELEADDYEMSVEIDVNEFDDSRADPYAVAALFDNVPGQILNRARFLPQKLVLDLLAGGGAKNAWDGQFFFDNDHPVDPYGNASTTWSNVLTGSALSATTLNNAVDQIMGWKLPNGDFTNVTTADMTLIVPPQLRATAQGILSAPTLAGGQFNPNFNLMRWEVWPELQGLGSAPTTTWYVLIARDDAKPFILLERKAPDIVVLNQPDAPGVFYRRKIHMGGHARYAAGYGLPQCALRGTA